MAPKFTIVSKPNDWTKTVREQAAAREAGPLSDFQRLHLEFWTQFRQYLEDRGSPIRITRPSKNHWSNVPVSGGLTSASIPGMACATIGLRSTSP